MNYLGKDDKDDKNYYVPFKNAKLTKREANVIGLSIIFGFLGAIVAALLPLQNRILAIGIIIVFALAGYVIANLLKIGK